MERLKTLAAEIERRFPDLVTVLDHFTYSTDRHPAGVRWRVPGKGRKGTRLRVWRRGEEQWRVDPVLEHRSGETYRRNQDVRNWISRETEWRKRGGTPGHPDRMFWPKEGGNR